MDVSKNNKGQTLIGIIIVVVIAGLVGSMFYLYLNRQIPEAPEIFKKPAEEKILEPEEVTPPPEEELPEEKVPPEEKVEEKPAEKVQPEPPKIEPICQNECSQSGLKRCSGNNYQICGNYDIDDCLEWSSLYLCGGREVCQDGVCVQKTCPDGTPDMECSVTKPLYCQNFKLVNACTTCGCPEGMVCYQNSTCVEVDLGNKVYVLENGAPEGKLDLLFIPAGISNFSTLRAKINDILYKSGTDVNGLRMVSLFNTEPFKSYKNKFNVAYIDKNIDKALFDCYEPEPDPTKPPQRLFFSCNDNKIKDAYKIFEPDYITVLFAPTYTSSGGEIQYLDISLESSDRFANLSWTFVHEFAHQFGGLADEYILTGSPSHHCGTATTYSCFDDYKKAVEIYPNLDTIGCPKWCKSYDINKDNILMDEHKLCGIAKNKEECAGLTQKYFGMPACTWFELEHPFFDSHCISTQGGGDIGIDCEDNAGCYFGGDYGQLAFNPGGDSIMGGGREFNAPSRNHLESIFKCCYPRQETSFCQNFRDKFKNLPASVHPSLGTAYNKILSCQ